MTALFLSLLAFLYLSIGANFGLKGAFYGEGLILTTVMRILSGELLYRDIATVYPPGIFLLGLLGWKWIGATLLADRIVSLIVQAALCGTLYATCRRIMSPLSSLLAFLAALACLGRATLFGYPTLPALIFVFASLQALCASLEDRSGLKLFWAGALAALAGLFRHEFALYLLIVFAVLATFRRAGAKAFLFLAGFILLFASWAVPLVLKGAPLASALFLYLNPAYSRAMALTFPAFDRAGAIHYVPLLTAAAGFLYLRLRRADRLFISLLLFHTISLVNFLNRPDRPHLAAPLILSCPLFFFLMERYDLAFGKAKRRFSLIQAGAVALTLVFLFRPTVQRLHFLFVERRAADVFHYTLDRLSEMSDSDPAGKALEEAVRFVVQQTKKDERIFVGLPRHDDPAAGDLLFYFLCDRLPAVRYQELGERGMTMSEEGQAAIIEELEKQDVRWIAIHSFPKWDVSYRYPTKGALLLDEYLRKQYQPSREFPPYRILRKRPHPASFD